MCAPFWECGRAIRICCQLWGTGSTEAEACASLSVFGEILGGHAAVCQMYLVTQDQEGGQAQERVSGVCLANVAAIQAVQGVWRTRLETTLWHWSDSGVRLCLLVMCLLVSVW